MPQLTLFDLAHPPYNVPKPRDGKREYLPGAFSWPPNKRFRQLTLELSLTGFRPSTRPSPLNLMDLPQELLDQIYEEYFTHPGGYRVCFDTTEPETQCVIGSDGKKIDLSLRLVSVRLAKDTKGLAFKYNALHFSPEPEVLHPARVDTLDTKQFGLYMDLRTFLDEQILHASRRLLTPILIDEITYDFPQYRGALNDLIANERRVDMFHGCKGDPMSIRRAFVLHALDILHKLPHFTETVRAAPSWNLQPLLRPAQIIRPVPVAFWKYPPRYIDDDVADRLQQYKAIHLERRAHIELIGNLSAAALAIRFLQRLPSETMSQIRNVHLNEDKPSISYPETHAQGLRPLLEHYPKLHVHRKVSIDSAILDSIDSVARRDYRGEGRLADKWRIHAPYIVNNKGASWMTSTIWPWISEVLAFSATSKSSSQFTFEFVHGTPNTMEPCRFFEFVQRDLAWQGARRIAYQKDMANGIPASETHHTRYLWPHYEMIRSAVQDIIDKSSPVKCNFETRPVYSSASLFTSNGKLRKARWRKRIVSAQEWRPIVLLGGPRTPPTPLAETYEALSKQEADLHFHE